MNYKKQILLVLSLLFSFAYAFSQATGKWEGHISVKGMKIGIEFEFDKGENGVMNVPGQGAYDLKIDRRTFMDQSMSLVVDSARSNMRFKGKFVNTDSLAGTFVQHGAIGRFMISRAKEKKESNNWVDREVRFSNDTVTLAGTLSLPDTVNTHAVVILVSGSGQQNRDENIFGFKVFKKMVPAFIEKGIAVLRYDDRATGESDHGNPNACTTRDFAKDAMAAYDFLGNHANIDKSKIGMLGHSEGGIIAPMVAQQRDLAFVVMMAGTTVPGDQVLMKQSEAVLKTMGYDREEMKRTLKANREIYDELLKQNPDSSKIKAIFFQLAEDNGESLDSSAAITNIERQSWAVMLPWFRFFLKYDPAVALRELDAPTLVLFGGKDVQVLPEQNRKLIDDFIAAGKKNFTLKVFPEANHLFQDAETGSVQEYKTLPPEFIDGYLEYVTQWVKKSVE